MLICATLAEKMVPSRGYLFMRLTDGQEVEVSHVNPGRGQLLYHAGSPAIFLKMADGPNLLLPIVVGEAAVELLMKGLHGSGRMARPNQYEGRSHAHTPRQRNEGENE